MKKRNGFVLVETLVVVLLLTVTLMSLYASFAFIVSKTKERNNNDSIDTLYKTYYVKNLIDVAYAASDTTEVYKNSFIYYYLDSTASWKNICRTYDYNSGVDTTSSATKNNQYAVICDYSSYYADTPNENIKKDPIFETVLAYGIEKIYYVDYSKLGESSLNAGKEGYTRMMNMFDATSIDYIREQSSDLSGNFLIIKYKKKVSRSTGHGEATALDVSTEAYHSSIAMTEIVTNSTLAPVYYYADSDSAAIVSDEMYPNDYVIPLYNMFDSTVHPGESLLGWTTNTMVNNKDTLVACLAGDAAYSGISCYKNNTDVRLTSKNRNLYAVWCGDGTLSGVLSCSLSSAAASTSNSGLFTKPESNGATTYYYSGSYDALDNFVVYNNQCFRLLSNYGSNTGFKAIYSGIYSTTNGCSTKGVLGSGSAFSVDAKGFQGNGYMYRTAGTPALSFSSNYYVIVKMGLFTNKTYNNTTTQLLEFGPESYVTFAKTATYDSVNKVYTLDKTDSKTIKWFGSAMDMYKDITSAGVTEMYFCKDGSVTCSEDTLYYLKSINTEQHITYFTYVVYSTTGGIKYKDVYATQVLFTNNISYDSSTGYYNLSGDEYLSTVNRIGGSSTSYKPNDKLLAEHPYTCLVEYVNKKEDKNIKCKTAYKFVYKYNSGSNQVSGFIKLEDGRINDSEIWNYYAGDRNKSGAEDERTLSSTSKQTVDNWYESKIAVSGTNYKDVIDYTATFCNDTRIGAGFNSGSLRTDFTTGNYITSYSSSTNRLNYLECDKWDNYGTSDATNGNGLLTYPAGLITYAEAKLIPNYSYLSSSNVFWTITPYVDESMYYIGTNGAVGITNNRTTTSASVNAYYIRPIIAFKNTIEFTSGNGSIKTPYIIKNK